MHSSKKINQKDFGGFLPPQDLDAESAVLGAVLIEKDAFDVAAGILRAECFYTEAHQIIFSAASDLAKKHSPIDPVTISKELLSRKQLDLVGGNFYLMQLTRGVYSSANIDAHARIVYEKFAARELIKVSSDMMALAFEGSEDIFDLIDEAEKRIVAVGLKGIDGGLLSMEKVMMQSIEKIEYWRSLDSHITGIPSGYKLVDMATRGWQPGDFIVIGARPSVGKTAFALNLVRNAAMLKRDSGAILVASLEMKAFMLGLRMLAAESETLLSRLLIGKLSDEDIKQLYSGAINRLSKMPVYFDESSRLTVSKITRKARQLKKKKGLSMIMIDYLQLMSCDERAGNREQEISIISRGFKNLAQELNVPIIALSQLSREMGVKNVSWEFGPPISAMRESGAIEQDADVIMMLWAPTDEDKAREPSLEGKRRVRIAKQRNGVLITQEFDFRNDIQLFESVQELHELPKQGNWSPVKE